MELKSETIGYDPWEQDYGRLLLFGHLHAHALERILHFRIPHSVAVFLGILLDLQITQSLGMYDELLQGVGLKRWTLPAELEHLDVEVLERVYRSSNKSVFKDRLANRYRALKITEIGEFSIAQLMRLFPERSGHYQSTFEVFLTDVSRRQQLVFPGRTY